MKKYVTALLIMSSTIVFGQNQIDTYIKEAQSFIVQKNYKQAQLSLQDAISEINSLIAKQVLESLPKEINGLISQDGEVNANTMGMVGGGMQITKTYKHPSKPDNEAELQIVANSPMLAGLSMFLTNPNMLGKGQKSVRVGTQRAILKTESSDYEIQIPMNQTLITINARGFASEQEALAFASKLDLAKIKSLIGE